MPIYAMYDGRITVIRLHFSILEAVFQVQGKVLWNLFPGEGTMML